MPIFRTLSRQTFRCDQRQTLRFFENANFSLIIFGSVPYTRRWYVCYCIVLHIFRAWWSIRSIMNHSEFFETYPDAETAATSMSWWVRILHFNFRGLKIITIGFVSAVSLNLILRIVFDLPVVVVLWFSILLLSLFLSSLCMQSLRLPAYKGYICSKFLRSAKRNSCCHFRFKILAYSVWGSLYLSIHASRELSAEVLLYS